MIKIEKALVNTGNITKEQLTEDAKKHIEDVRQGLAFFGMNLILAADKHDHTKISHIGEFQKFFKSGCTDGPWWDVHRDQERHHLKDAKFVQEDVNLIDIFEMLTDGVMAGMARKGKYKPEELPAGLLQRAFDNTTKMLLQNVLVEEEEVKDEKN